MCLYVAVFVVSIVLSSMFGTLELFPVSSTPSTFVIYFLNAKSKSFVSGIFSNDISGCVFSCLFGSALEYNVTFVFGVAVLFAYAVAFVFAVVIK